MLQAFLVSLLIASPFATATAHTPQTNAEQSKHKMITAEELKSMYDQNKPMTVLDGRSKKFMNGTVLPNAKWMPLDSSDADIQAAVPSKDSLVIVYCASAQCPISSMLYDKLTSLGYTNVLEFHGGINEWVTKRYPTMKL